MPNGEFRHAKLRTVLAMARLCRAQLLINWVPFNRWSLALGFTQGRNDPQAKEEARGLAADIEWAARRLPFQTKCLPRAMALSWKLRSRRISHSVVIAVRPSQLRKSPDALHAWVDVAGDKILGDLAGPWIETARLGA